MYLSVFLSASLYAASFQGLGDLPGGPVYSEAWSMSADGSTIVGSSGSANGQEAFLWTAEEGMVPLGDLPGTPFQSGATSVSSDGFVIVGFGNIAGKYKAFHYTNDNGITELPSSVTVNNQTYNYSTIATGMSADGSVIIGKANFTTAQFGGPNQSDKACYWSDGQLHLLTPPGYGSFSGAQTEAVSANGSTILIRTSYNNGYIWSESNGFQELPTVPRGFWYSMSGDATVLGGYDPTARTSFLWSENTGLTQIELPEGWDENKISYINTDGSLATGSLVEDEYYSTFNPQYMKAYLWDEIDGIHLVEDILTGNGIDLLGWHLTSAAISSDGSILYGNGVNPHGFEEAWIAIIPEPATLLLTLSGAWIAFRRRN